MPRDWNQINQNDDSLGGCSSAQDEFQYKSYRKSHMASRQHTKTANKKYSHLNKPIVNTNNSQITQKKHNQDNSNNYKNQNKPIKPIYKQRITTFIKEENKKKIKYKQKDQKYQLQSIENKQKTISEQISHELLSSHRLELLSNQTVTKIKTTQKQQKGDQNDEITSNDQNLLQIKTNTIKQNEEKQQSQNFNSLKPFLTNKSLHLEKKENQPQTDSKASHKQSQKFISQQESSQNQQNGTIRLTNGVMLQDDEYESQESLQRMKRAIKRKNKKLNKKVKIVSNGVLNNQLGLLPNEWIDSNNPFSELGK